MGAERLWLTSLGAWLELHGQWATQPYSKADLASVLAWDHVATGGRDQFVRVVYPGYLYPLGQPTVRVKITERSIRPTSSPTAGLFQRQFLVVIDPIRAHGIPGFPLTRTVLRPVVTPSLDPTGDDVVPGLTADQAFWPRVGGRPFAFRVDAVDRDGRDVAFSAPLIWVAEDVQGSTKLNALDKGYAESARRVIDLGGQTVAYVTKEDAGDARLETRTMRLRGTAVAGTQHTPAVHGRRRAARGPGDRRHRTRPGSPTTPPTARAASRGATPAGCGRRPSRARSSPTRPTPPTSSRPAPRGTSRRPCPGSGSGATRATSARTGPAASCSRA